MSTDTAHQTQTLSADTVRARCREITRGLRGHMPGAERRNGVDLAPGLSLFWDDSHDGLRVVAGSGAHAARQVGIEVSGRADWLSLTLWLGVGAIRAGSALVVVCDLEAEDAFEIRPFLRTGAQSSESDTVLDDTLRAGPGRSVSTLIHVADPFEPICRSDEGQSLVLPLPIRSVSFGIHSLSLHLVPPDDGPLRPLDRLSAALG